MYTKQVRKKGKVSQRAYFQDFKEGEIVNIGLEPSIHKGSSHPKYVGKSGKILGKDGSCYKILLKDREKVKTVTVHPVHLKKVK